MESCSAEYWFSSSELRQRALLPSGQIVVARGWTEMGVGPRSLFSPAVDLFPDGGLCAGVVDRRGLLWKKSGLISIFVLRALDLTLSEILIIFFSCAEVITGSFKWNSDNWRKKYIESGDCFENSPFWIKRSLDFEILKFWNSETAVFFAMLFYVRGQNLKSVSCKSNCSTLFYRKQFFYKKNGQTRHTSVWPSGVTRIFRLGWGANFCSPNLPSFSIFSSDLGHFIFKWGRAHHLRLRVKVML